MVNMDSRNRVSVLELGCVAQLVYNIVLIIASRKPSVKGADIVRLRHNA